MSNAWETAHSTTFDVLCELWYAATTCHQRRRKLKERNVDVHNPPAPVHRLNLLFHSHSLPSSASRMWVSAVLLKLIHSSSAIHLVPLFGTPRDADKQL